VIVGKDLLEIREAAPSSAEKRMEPPFRRLALRP